jgi:acetoin utilization deacetylase AcuC-like enzyme
VKNEVALYVGESLARYGFPNGHPWGTDRQAAFWKEAVKQGLDKRAAVTDPRMAAQEELHRFHTPEHVSWVKDKSEEGYGAIDYGFSSDALEALTFAKRMITSLSEPIDWVERTLSVDAGAGVALAGRLGLLYG